jgi:chemotaxis signal transduction protein
MTATRNTAPAEARFSWQAASARLNRVLDKLEAAANPPPERIQQVLRERALRYAAARRSEVSESFVEIIGFAIGEDRLAVEIGQGAAVAELSNLTRLPGVPAFYLGLISHRGSIFPVVDPRPLLGVNRGAGFNAHYAVLVRGGDGAIGLAADAIQGIGRYRDRDIATAAGETARLRAVRGIAADGTMIIDAAQLLQDARLLVDDQPMIAAN